MFTYFILLVLNENENSDSQTKHEFQQFRIKFKARLYDVTVIIFMTQGWSIQLLTEDYVMLDIGFGGFPESFELVKWSTKGQVQTFHY